MSDKPVIFISYSHLDEPEHPRADEVQWLTFARKFFGPLEKHGVLKVWDDRQIRGGAGWHKNLETQLDACDLCALLVSPNSLASDFILNEEMQRMLQRRKEEGVEIFPIVITPTPFKGADWLTEMQLRPGRTQPLSSYSLHERETKMVAIVEEITEILEEMAVSGVRQAKSRQGSLKIPEIVDIDRLPLTPYKALVGRDDELRALDAAWNDELTNIISLIAWGGAGKTALINEWLKRLQADNYRDASAVLGWSFYDQGTKERTTAADQFLNWALEKLGIKVDAPSATVKGEKLAEGLAERRVLLVLDGVEPLQHGPGGQEGLLKDQGLRSLLRRFAAVPPASAHGLIVIMSRITVRDIEQYERTTNKLGSSTVIDLSRLSDVAGSVLLLDNGVQGMQTELVNAAREFEGHALALSLLASFLVRRHNGDVRRRDRVGPLLQKTDARGHEHARRVMQTYEKEWLQGEPVLMATLHLIGLFDRPADVDCINALRNEPVLEGLSEPLINLNANDWADALAALREVRLLSPRDAAAPDTVDAHPLVREWFGERLRVKSGTAWRRAQGRLYEHLRDTTKEGLRPSIDQLAPLYQAIAHGCQAGRYHEALTDVFKARICRYRRNGDIDYYSVFRLGAISSDLAAIGSFFEQPFDVPTRELEPPEQSWVLGIAAFRLACQGRLTEALSVQKARLKLEIDAGRWADASTSARGLSSYEVLLGKIEDASVMGDASITYAEKSGDVSQIIECSIVLGHVLHAAGDRNRARQLLNDAEHEARKRNPNQSLLQNLGGYLICEMSLAVNRWDDVRRRASRALAQAQLIGFLFPISLFTLALGRAHFGFAIERFRVPRLVAAARDDARAARNWFDKAIDRLRATN